MITQVVQSKHCIYSKDMQLVSLREILIGDFNRWREIQLEHLTSGRITLSQFPTGLIVLQEDINKRVFKEFDFRAHYMFDGQQPTSPLGFEELVGMQAYANQHTVNNSKMMSTVVQQTKFFDGQGKTNRLEPISFTNFNPMPRNLLRSKDELNG